VVVLPRFSVGSFWQDAAKFECTQTLLVGAMARFLMSSPPSEQDRAHVMRHVNMCPIIPDVEQFAERFGVSICSTYGLTEGGTPLVTDYGDAAPSLAGVVRDDYDVRIFDDRDLELTNGTVGEIVVRSRQPWLTMVGYHGLPDKTNEAFRNLWLHTGDSGYRDDDGNFYFVDRIDDAIRVRGENISSFEVESVVEQHPNVETCIAIAVKSEHTEDELKIVVVLNNEKAVSGEELTYYLADRLPYFMVPRYIEFVTSLPRTPTEKVKRDVLRASAVTADTWDREVAGVVIRRETTGSGPMLSGSAS
jgi:crotonobetaine/carnitine-CoA ligase